LILAPLPAPGLVYLVPFSDLREQSHHPPAYVIEQIGGILPVFAGSGFLAPIRWHLRPLWIFLRAAQASASVETLQWALPGQHRWWPARRPVLAPLVAVAAAFRVGACRPGSVP
jgi:hypothetical protein